MVNRSSRRRGSTRRTATDRIRLVSWVLALAGATLLFAVAVLVLRPGPNVRDLSPAVAAAGPASSGTEVTVVWLGDTLLGDAAQPQLDREGYEWAGARLDLVPGDVTIANLEGPITASTEPWDATRRWSYNAMPAAADALAGFGVDAVSLANNHAMDRGPDGVADTIEHAAAAGIATFGAGEDFGAASLPLFLESTIGDIAVVGMTDTSNGTSRADRAGVHPLTAEAAEAAADAARSAGARWIVAFVHWGENYAGITADQREQARVLVAAGYDLVVGHGAHVVQPVEWIDGTPVVYSLGNWIFGTPGRFPDPTLGRGMVLATTFDSDGRITLRTRCVATDNAQVDYQPEPCPTSDLRGLIAAEPPTVTMDATGRLSPVSNRG